MSVRKAIEKEIKEYESDAAILRKYGDKQGANLCRREIIKLKRKLK